MQIIKYLKAKVNSTKQDVVEMVRETLLKDTDMTVAVITIQTHIQSSVSAGTLTNRNCNTMDRNLCNVIQGIICLYEYDHKYN